MKNRFSHPDSKGFKSLVFIRDLNLLNESSGYFIYLSAEFADAADKEPEYTAPPGRNLAYIHNLKNVL
jgi:hypothetical protein